MSAHLYTAFKSTKTLKIHHFNIWFQTNTKTVLFNSIHIYKPHITISPTMQPFKPQKFP
jgi:hypothetical protein